MKYCTSQICSLHISETLHIYAVDHILHGCVDASQISQCNANIQFTRDKKGCTTFQSAIISPLIPIQIIYHDKFELADFKVFTIYLWANITCSKKHNVTGENSSLWTWLKFTQTLMPSSSQPPLRQSTLIITIIIILITIVLIVAIIMSFSVLSNAHSRDFANSLFNLFTNDTVGNAIQCNVQCEMCNMQFAMWSLY